MIPHYQIPRNTLLWLFATQVLVLLPHIQRTPVWIALLLVFSIAWRIQVFRGRWSFPKKIIKVPLTLATVAGLIISFPAFFGLEALVSTLFVAYGLKLLEMYHKRDALILLYLSFFLVMSGFLFDQNMVLAVFNVLVLCVIATALIGLYQDGGYHKPWRSFRYAAVMVIQALPLMVLMFVLLPRFPSLWSIPLQKNNPKTGMSDSMSPGDFSSLTQSADPVMRITFNGAVPDANELYWRGLVFSHFDGRRWEVDESSWGKPRGFVAAAHYRDNRQVFLQEISAYGLVENTNDKQQLSYEVIVEASQTPWLYALSNSIPDTQDIWVNYEQLLIKHGVVAQRFKYDVHSYSQVSVINELPQWQRNINLALPQYVNPQALKMARQWREKNSSDEAYARYLLDWFHREFFYTLQPPPLGKDSVDEFLFNTKKGFCEHFASSFVFMLRAAGIPARVVVGYQGGEWNPYEHYLLVRQYDAHAWAEVWLEGRGWVRYDPTFAVAPQRILDGFRNTFLTQSNANVPVLSLERYRNLSWLHALQQQWDRVNYNWARWVLAYDADRQKNLLANILGEYSVTRIALIFGSMAAIFLGALYGFLLWQERDKNPDPLARLYRKFCRNMKQQGFEPHPGEAPQAFLRRIARSNPDKYSHLEQASDALYQYWYQGSVKAPEIAKLRRALFK